jgi:fatty acid desaturase
MDDVPREVLRKAYQRNHIYLLKIPMAYGLWAACVWVLFKTHDSPYAIPIGIACSILIMNLIRGLGAIAHDAVHGNVFRNKTAAYWVSLLCWAPTGMSVTIYGNYHLHHHKIANTYPDVDNFVVTDYTRNPFLAKVILLSVFTFGYPIYFMFQMFRYMKRLSFLKRVRVNVEVFGYFGLIYFISRYMPGQVFFFFFVLPFIGGAFLASVTSMIEHYDMEPGEDAYSSRTYGSKAIFTNFLWNNVSIHNEHHKFPGIPWYNLRSFHEEAFPYYDARVQAECYKTIWPVAFMLWGRILRFDVQKQLAKYESIQNKQAEKEHALELPGIPVEAG